MIMQVLDACASSLPLAAATSFASAVAWRRPRCTTSASARTTPVSRVIGRTNFASRVSVV